MFIIKKKGRLENMPRRRMIRAPAKILYGLRFKNRCVKCGKEIPPDRVMCSTCSKKLSL